VGAAPPDALLAAVRALHFAAAIVLFGQFAFSAFVAPNGQPPPYFRRMAVWSLAALLASALAWLALEAVSMSGLAAKQALSPATLGTVIAQTQFGRAWLARLVACALLVAVLASPRAASPRVPGFVLSAFILAGLAAMGHGGSGRGVAGALHFGADAAHLLAAGAWLGALLPLVLVIRSAQRAGDQSQRFATQATRRFSTLGVASMLVIVLSGVANSCFMLSSVAALVDSSYGRWLLAKLALFAVILALAAINRQRLASRLAAPDGRQASAAFCTLGRNAMLECALGFAIVAIVAKLGITMPASHPMG
jgi:copper resistance protein D